MWAKKYKSKKTLVHKSVLHDNWDNVVFSFKYMKSTSKFCITKYTTLNHTKTFMERLRDLCSLDSRSVKLSWSKALRAHRIDFSSKSVSEKGFWIPNEDEIIWEWAFQMQISTNNWRIHWFFTWNVFHIVWIDPDHLLYPWR